MKTASNGPLMVAVKTRSILPSGLSAPSRIPTLSTRRFSVFEIPNAVTFVFEGVDDLALEPPPPESTFSAGFEGPQAADTVVRRRRRPRRPPERPERPHAVAIAVLYHETTSSPTIFMSRSAFEL